MRSYKGYIKDDPNFHTLYENTVMTLGNVFENSYLYNKLTQQEFAIFQFYGDPNCGLVAKDNDWCLIGGEVLVFYMLLGKYPTVTLIGDLRDVHSLRMIDKNIIQILIDPWSEEAAIWQLVIVDNPEKSVRPTSLTKLREFNDYKDQPYTEDINW